MFSCADKRRFFQITNSPLEHFLVALLFAILVVGLPQSSDAQTASRNRPPDNAKFVVAGLESFADTLLTRGEAFLGMSRVSLTVEAGRYAEQLLNALTAELTSVREMEVYLQPPDSLRLPRLETRLDAIELSYVGIGRGVLKFPAIDRRLLLSGFGRVIDSDGKLLSTISVADLVFSDTLSYADAEAARGYEPFLAPSLPASPYRRLVEPGLVLTITGALVYVFFASR